MSKIQLESIVKKLENKGISHDAINYIIQEAIYSGNAIQIFNSYLDNKNI